MLNIKKLRVEKKLTQGELADMVEVSLRTIQHWEKGTKNITVDKLNKINEVFGLNVNQVTYNEDRFNFKNSHDLLLKELSLKDEMIEFYKKQIYFYERNEKNDNSINATINELNEKVESLHKSIIKLSISKKIDQAEEMLKLNKKKEAFK